MAVAAGRSSSFAWPSVSSSSSYFRRNLKSASWRYSHGQKYGTLQLNYAKVYEEKPLRIVQRSIKSEAGFLVRQLMSFATSEGQSSLTELDLDPSESDISEGDSLRGNPSYLTERSEGKPGFISFHGIPYQRRDETFGYSPSKETYKIFWFIGPTVLVAFLVFPSLYLRKILSTVFEDSLLTDFLILFFTEALFYSGVAIFVLLVDLLWRPLQQLAPKAPKNNYWSKNQYGLRVSSVATLALSLVIPLVTMGMVWPWTGPAASATLAPYLVGLVVQFAFEQYARYQKSPAWPVIPVIFQVYRLHQLNRAAQLVTALSFSVRGAEMTSQTLAVSNSLGTLLIVLQILGIICIWSLSSFLMRFLPSSQAIPES